MAEKLLECPVCKKADFTLFLEVKDYFLTMEDFLIQSCDGCGFKFVNPRPDKNEIGRYYQSDEYISHDAQKENFISRIYKLARVFSIKGKHNIVKRYTPSGRILDIGCGTGEFLNYCKSKGYDVEGVEPNEKAGIYSQQVNKIPVAKTLKDVDSGSFQCITMWHVLEHVHDLDETLDLVRGLLSPGGVFIAAVPNSDSWDARKYENFWAAYDVPRHLYHFTRTTLVRLVTNHGFILQELVPQKLDSYYVSMLSEKYRSGKINYLKALFFGFWSNVQAGREGRGHSSQIFVLQVKKS
ncbi:MAG: class I SAM-dependent methyltransferase [Bacteroidetes bacterium]|nr:class I SAM-dependent methyltransferase [Bacteroidota bacterium]